MPTVKDYAVKYKFGATSPSPWSPSKPHLGVDRPTPMRTPLVINGQLVAYTGRTGGVQPHHHLQKSVNHKAVDPKNEGFNIPTPAIVYQTDNVDDTNIGKALRIRDAQGVEWSHFHLDEILVKVNDKIGGNMAIITDDQKYRLIKGMTGRDVTQAEASNRAYNDNPGLAIDTFWENGGKQRFGGRMFSVTDAQIDEWISKQHFIAFGKPAPDAVFNAWRPVLKNNFADGSISILKGIDGNAGALKNQPTGEYEKVNFDVYRKKA